MPGKKLNQFGDYEDVTYMSAEDWNYRWEKGDTRFHMERVHPMLEKFLNKLTEKPRQKFFLPLSGKSLDLKWLSDKGHNVTGNDCSDLGCQQFFQEHRIPYSKEDIPGLDGSVYKATDDRDLKMYCCDFFALNKKILGEFDCIWDRGSFVAISVDQRKQYVETILPLLAPDGRYLLDTFQLDHDVFAGPPFDCTFNDVKHYFGSTCNIQLLEEKDAFGEWQKSWGVRYFFEQAILIELNTKSGS